MIPPRRATCIALAVVLASALHAHAQTLIWLNAPPPGTPITEPPRLTLSLGGRSVPAVIDTGSTGIVVSADLVADFAILAGEPGTLTYSSSGRVMHGRWVTVPATLTDAHGRQVTTRPLPVLAVTGETCWAHARNCVPHANPRGIAVIGIGFGREDDHQPQSTPDHNPLLAMPWTGTQGYTITRQALRIGLDTDSRAGFRLVKLTRNEHWRDWNQAPLCIEAGGAPPVCGVSLMDTGVVNMYLAAPGTTPGPGTNLEFLLGGPHPVARYGFTIGQHASPMAPRTVILTHHPHAFANLTIRFLNGFDYLYDATEGEVGYRPHPLPPGAR